LAKKCSGVRIKGIDTSIEEIADQEVMTEEAEISRR
jgi:hypothetical protein